MDTHRGHTNTQRHARHIQRHINNTSFLSEQVPWLTIDTHTNYTHKRAHTHTHQLHTDAHRRTQTRTVTVLLRGLHLAEGLRRQSGGAARAPRSYAGSGQQHEPEPGVGGGERIGVRLGLRSGSGLVEWGG